MAPVTFRCLCTCVREQLIQILTALLISEFAKSFCKLFSGDVGDLVCRKGAMLSCRSSGVWARGVWRYHRTRTLPLPPGTPRSGQLDLWHILQTASPHMLLPGKEIQKKKKKRDQCPQDAGMAILPCCCWHCLGLQQSIHRWEILPILSLWGCFCQGKPSELLTLWTSLTGGLPCREAKICWHLWLDFIEQRGFYRMAFCMPSTFSTRDHSY